MPTDGKAIIKRRDQLKDKRKNHEQRWARHAPYMSPWSSIGFADGQSTQTQVYDATAIYANDLLSNFICGEIINPAEKYLSYKHSDDKLNDEDEVKEWLEECTDRVLREVARSNFYTEAPTMIAGVTGFGTGSLFRGERLPEVSERRARPQWRGLRFKTDRIGRFLIAEDANGNINTCFREFEYTARQMADRWKNVPKKVDECIKGNKQDEKFNIVHAVYPRVSGDRGYGSRGMPWASCFVVDDSEQFILEEGGFERYPFANPRWDIIPGEVYGRCPSDIAFNDVLTVNSAEQLDMEAWALDARPPTFAATDTGIGTLDLLPGMFVGVRMRPGTTSMESNFWRYTSGAQHQINEIREEKKKQAIRQAYFVDQIVQMLQVEKTQMTAYEFGRKLELMFRILGPIYGRFQSEFLKPEFDGIFEDMFEAGQFAPPPDILMETENGGDIDIQFENPLARAQKSTEVEALKFAMGDLSILVEMEMKLKGYSNAMDWLDEDKAAKKIFDVRGVPASIVRSDKEVDQMRQAKQAAQQQQAQQEQQASTAEGLGKIAPFLTAVQGNGTQQ